MDWAFDRLYKEDITHELEKHGWEKEDVHVTWHATNMAGEELDVSGFPTPTILFEPGHHDSKIHVKMFQTRIVNAVLFSCSTFKKEKPLSIVGFLLLNIFMQLLNDWIEN